MNVFRLVNPGSVDKIIAFDALPKRLLAGIKTKDLKGYPRYWRTWLKENGAFHQVKRWNVETLKHDEVDETFTYILDMLVNEDKERWQAITNYVRKAVDLSVRLLDKIDDMAIKVAKDSTSELNIDPEQVPVIPVPLEFKEIAEPARIIRPKEEEEVPLVDAPIKIKNKGGRPRKVTVEA